MLEKIKKLQSVLGVTVDGIIGPKTLQEICAKLGVEYSLSKRTTVKNIQKAVGTTVDGLIGSRTIDGIINRLNALTPKPTLMETLKNYWQKWFGTKDKDIIEAAKDKMSIDELISYYTNKPVTFTDVKYTAELVKQATIRGGKSRFGIAGDESNLVSVQVPANYPLKYEGSRVKSIRVHKLVADRLEAALKDIANHYGDDLEKVAPGACVYDGSYNFRKTRNSSSQSIHSWGLAIDLDAANNGLKTNWPNARFSKPVYKPFLDIMEHHGWRSLGRRSGNDGMHFQATNWDS